MKKYSMLDYESCKGRLPKWIIINSVTRGPVLIIGVVEWHRDLLNDTANYTKEDQVLGGGEFRKSRRNKELFLFGESGDYGKCDVEDVMGAFENYDNIPADLKDYSVRFSTLISAYTATKEENSINIKK